MFNCFGTFGGGQKRRNQGGGGGRRNRSWSRSWRRICIRSGESISYHVLRSRNVDHGACELSQGGEVALLGGGPQRRDSKQSMSERFEVSKKW